MTYPEYSPSVTLFPCNFKMLHQFNGVLQLCPGLAARSISESEKASLGDSFTIHYNRERFQPNFVVSVDESAYLRGLADRLGTEVRSLEEALTLKGPDGNHRIPIIPDDLFRWALVSLYLCYDLDIRLPSARYGFRFEGDSLIPSDSGATHAGFERSIYTTVAYHKHLTWPIDFNIVRRIAALTEIYYRPVRWQYDPISVALSCFWSAIYSIFPDQAYMSLVAILEALLSTGTAEISHQIAERVVVLIGRDRGKSIELYRHVKKLYDLRSRIAHGDLVFRKGVINWNSSIVSAKTTIIAMPELASLAQTVTEVFRSVLESDVLMTALQQSNKNRRKESVDEYFLAQLFLQ